VIPVQLVPGPAPRLNSEVTFTPTTVQPLNTLAVPTTPTPVQAVGLNHRETAGQSVLRLLNDIVPVSELRAAIDRVTPLDIKTTDGLTEELIQAATKSSEVELRVASARALVRGGVYTPAVKAAFETIAQDAEAAVRTEGERGRTLAR
jgi:hypothetical protein